MNTAVTPDNPAYAWYALRRTLPPVTFEENLRELVQELPRYKVDEVIIKVDTEELSHGQPPVPWVQAYLPSLHRVREEMESLGIVYSLNPWITVGHCDRGRDNRSALPGLRTMVAHDGTEAHSVACQLCPVWRDNIATVWKLYAQTRPYVIWIEDDIRTFNHRPVEFWCFCELHMQRFSELIGRDVSREELTAAILQPGQPHPWRQQWIDMHGQIMEQTMQHIVQAVWSESPDIRIGLMSSGPRRHGLDGRNWSKVVDILGGPAQPVQAADTSCTPDMAHDHERNRPAAERLYRPAQLFSRPPLGSYNEESLRGLYYAQDSIKITRHCLCAPRDSHVRQPCSATTSDTDLQHSGYTAIIEQSEVENWPFTTYSVSTQFTFLKMAVSFALGAHGVTMNIYDHLGTPMQDQPAFGAMLAEKKPFLTGLAQRARQDAPYRGIQVLLDPDAPRHRCLDADATFEQLTADGYEAMELLECMGLPTTYSDEPVAVATGQTLRGFSDDDITTLLGSGRGLLLDAPAAGVLLERGFGDHIGLQEYAPDISARHSRFRPRASCVRLPRSTTTSGTDLQQNGCAASVPGVLSAEEYFCEDFGGKDRTYMTLTGPTLGGLMIPAMLTPSPQATVISCFIDPDCNRHGTGAYAYENGHRGRVVVLPYHLADIYGPGFRNHIRRRQLHAMCGWLARGQFPVSTHAEPYPWLFRQDCENYSLIGVMNFSTDVCPETTFTISHDGPIRQTERLTDEGVWQEDPAVSITSRDGYGVVRYERAVDYRTPLFVCIYWQ